MKSHIWNLFTRNPIILNQHITILNTSITIPTLSTIILNPFIQNQFLKSLILSLFIMIVILNQFIIIPNHIIKSLFMKEHILNQNLFIMLTTTPNLFIIKTNPFINSCTMQ